MDNELDSIKKTTTLGGEIRKINWKFASRNIDDDFHTDIVFLRVSVRELAQFASISHDRALLHYKGFCGDFFYPEESSKKICESIINRLVENPEWGDHINEQIVIRSRMLEENWFGISNYLDFSKLSNNEVKEIYISQLNSQRFLYQAAWIPEVFQSKKYGLTNFLIRQLEGMFTDEVERNQIFQILTTSTQPSIYIELEQELYNLASKIIKSDKLRELFSLPDKYLRMSLPSSVNEKLYDLERQFSFLGYHGFGPRRAYDFDYYLFRLIELIKDNDVYLETKKNLELKSCTLRQKEEIIQKGKIKPQLAKIFQVYSDFAVSKARRRLAQLRNFYFLDKLIFDISLRLKVPESIIRFMMPEEIVDALNGGIVVPSSIEPRTKEMIYYVDDTNDEIIVEPKLISAITKENSEPDDFSNNEIRGIAASGGYVVGRAMKITRFADYEDVLFDEGLILVTIEADPDLLPVMKKSIAVITDQGGITCHAAVIAKEFNIPCVIGTEIATKYINTGDLLEVDASRGLIKIINEQI